MVSDFNASSPFLLDILPDDVSEDYEYLWYALKESIRDVPDSVLLWFDEQLHACESSEIRLRYLCHLVVGAPGVESVFSSATRLMRRDSYEYYDYAAWFAVRLIEVLVDYAGNARLRLQRKEIAAEWDITKRTASIAFGEEATQRLVKFAFSALQPFVVANKPQTVATAVGQVRQSATRPSGQNKPRSRSVAPQAGLASICHSPFSVEDVRSLLSELGVIDPDTGHWHLGTLTGKAAKPLSAFPAVYHALVEAKLIDELDAPVWRRLFMQEFNVHFSLRLANYSLGKASTEFNRYYREARRWISRLGEEN